jgi:hypothetical protein
VIQITHLRKETMKHFKPFRSVFDGDRYCGALIYSARGWQAHNAAGKVVGEFEDDQAAVRRLRSLAAQST